MRGQYFYFPPGGGGGGGVDRRDGGPERSTSSTLTDAERESEASSHRRAREEDDEESENEDMVGDEEALEFDPNVDPTNSWEGCQQQSWRSYQHLCDTEAFRVKERSLCQQLVIRDNSESAVEELIWWTLNDRS